ncbi:MAG: MDR family oxidoreductase [Myxococcota bacterium]
MRAWYLSEDADHPEMTSVDESSLPDGEVTIAVTHSSINYKDALALLGKAPIARKKPMVLGIDAAGTVLSDTTGTLTAGTPVVVNGGGLSETRWGGYAERIVVPADLVIPLPGRFSPADAMAIGTAGYTAALCVSALEEAGVKPEDGTVLVTGATGGVGSVAVSLLSKKGFAVAAATGRTDERDYLVDLGAKEIVDRSELQGKLRPLGKQRWAAAVDVVGGTVLANVLSMMNYGGKVAATGLAGGMDLPASVAPFILRGVHLLGVDSVQAPREKRESSWRLLEEVLPPEHLKHIASTVSLAEVKDTAAKLLDGKIKGRVVVSVAA